MQTYPRFLTAVKFIFGICFLSLSLFSASAHAQIVDTQTLIDKSQSEQNRQLIKDSLNREEVKIKLRELGVNPTDVQGRVDSLTDAEAQSLAQNINSLPAGGRADTVTILLIIIIIILLV